MKPQQMLWRSKHLSKVLVGFVLVACTISFLTSTSVPAASNETDSRAQPDLPTPAMLVEIETWLSKHFDLPMPITHPQVELASSAHIAAIRYRAFRRLTSDTIAGDGSDTVAVYEIATQTIYLPEGWTGAKPAEMSILVHEIPLVKSDADEPHVGSSLTRVSLVARRLRGRRVRRHRSSPAPAHRAAHRPGSWPGK
jgi:hypothetical protein